MDKTVNRLDHGERPEPPDEGEGFYGAYLEWVVETCGADAAACPAFEPPMSFEEWREMVEC